MATSESDGDFESADEELGRGVSSRRDTRTTTYWTSPTTVDSESDDEYVQHMPCRNSNPQRKHDVWITSLPDVPMSPMMKADSDKNDKTDSDVKIDNNARTGKSVDCIESTSDKQEDSSILDKISEPSVSSSTMENKDDNLTVASSEIAKSKDTMPKAEIVKSAEAPRTSRRNPSRQMDAKKLGTKISKHNINRTLVTDSVTTEQKDEHLSKSVNEESLRPENKRAECRLQEEFKDQLTDNQLEPQQNIDNLQEIDMPEELKSNKKFKEVFQPEGWEGLGNDIELPDELTEEKLQPILERLSFANKEPENFSESWGSWGSWGVTSFINTATAGVSTLTNHMSQGLTLFDSVTEVAEPTEVTRTEQDEVTTPSGMTSLIFLNI